jgi:hypothetical protein
VPWCGKEDRARGDVDSLIRIKSEATDIYDCTRGYYGHHPCRVGGFKRLETGTRLEPQFTYKIIPRHAKVVRHP